MRQDLHSPNIFDADIKSARLSHARRILADDFVITENGPLITFFDPNGSDRSVTLPVLEEGLFYVIANVGLANNLLVRNAGGVLQATVAPTQTLQIFASFQEWQGTKATTNLDVFTNTVDGLVPAPNSVAPGSLFLRDDGQWAQVQVVGIVDAFKYMSDGTNIAVGAGPDTFTFRSSTSKVGITVTNDEAVFGDNVNLTVNEAFVNHNALLNYSANQHVDHTTVSMLAGTGMSGGGTIAADRTFNFNPFTLTAAAPALTDYVVWDLAAGGPRKALWSAVNGVLDHNALLNYSANRHIDHTTVSMIAGMGLSGGGDISTSRTFNLDFTELPTDDVISAADLVPFYDTSEADHGTNTFTQFNGALDHNALANYVAAQHVNHTSVTLTAGAGLTGGGDISSSRTFDVGAGTGIAVNANDVALANIATLNLLANITGGSAAPIANTLTAILDAIIGSTRGQILVRKAAAWQALNLGLNNQFLKSDGTDALWATPAGGGDLLAANNLSDVANVDTARANLVAVKQTQLTSVALSGTVGTVFNIPTGCRQFTIAWSGCSGSSTGIPYMQLGDAGGPEGAGYLGVTIQHVPTLTPTGSLITTVIPIQPAAAAANTISGSAIFTLIDSATNLWAVMGINSHSDVAAQQTIAYSKALSQPLTTCSFLIGSGTFDAGIVGGVTFSP